MCVFGQAQLQVTQAIAQYPVHLRSMRHRPGCTGTESSGISHVMSGLFKTDTRSYELPTERRKNYWTTKKMMGGRYVRRNELMKAYPVADTDGHISEGREHVYSLSICKYCCHLLVAERTDRSQWTFIPYSFCIVFPPIVAFTMYSKRFTFGHCLTE
jgi:hypothetical protein